MYAMLKLQKMDNKTSPQHVLNFFAVIQNTKEKHIHNSELSLYYLFFYSSPKSLAHSRSVIGFVWVLTC